MAKSLKREPLELRQLLSYLRCTTMLRIYTYIPIQQQQQQQQQQ